MPSGRHSARNGAAEHPAPQDPIASPKTFQHHHLHHRALSFGEAAFTPENWALVQDVRGRHPNRVRVLQKQVEVLQETEYDAGLVYSLNAGAFDNPAEGKGAFDGRERAGSCASSEGGSDVGERAAALVED